MRSLINWGRNSCECVTFRARKNYYDVDENCCKIITKSKKNFKIATWSKLSNLQLLWYLNSITKPSTVLTNFVHKSHKNQNAIRTRKNICKSQWHFFLWMNADLRKLTPDQPPHVFVWISENKNSSLIEEITRTFSSTGSISHKKYLTFIAVFTAHMFSVLSRRFRITV